MFEYLAHRHQILLPVATLVVGVLLPIQLLLSTVQADTLSQQQDNNLMKQATPCWVEIYMNQEFDKNQPSLLLVGPHELGSLKGLKDRNWDNDIESILVGPRATLLGYEHADFKGRELVLGPNQRLSSLIEAQMSNEIESLRVICSQAR